MKKLLFISLLLGGFSDVGYATFTDFYMVTTGSDTSSGSTTDNAAPVATTNGNYGGGSALNRFTAASGTPFSSTLVGQYASISSDSATAAVFVSSIVAVDAGGTYIDVDTTTIKYGTSPSTSTIRRTCKIGGAWQSLAVVTSLFPSGTVPQSTRVNIKAGTYANTTTIRTFGMSGTATAPLWWRGYQTTIGDQDANNVAVAGTNIPTITYTTGNNVVSGTHQIFSNLDFTSASTTQPTLQATGANNLFYRVRSQATFANAGSRGFHSTAANNVVAACYFKATTTCNATVYMNSTSNAMFGCVVVSGTSGVSFGSTPAYVTGSVFDSQAGDAITMNGSVSLYAANNSIYAPTGHGINISGVAAAGSWIINNYFENVNQAGKAAIINTSGTNSDLIHVIGNAYFNCATNTSGITETFSIFDNPTLGSAAFTAPTSQNFSILPVAKGLGFPGKFENTSVYQGYLDVGAVQRQEKGSTLTFVQ